MEVKSQLNIKYILVLLDDGATSFCYYKNPQFNIKSSRINYKRLKSIVQYAEKNGYVLNLIYGKSGLTKQQKQLLQNVNYIDLKPITNNSIDENATLIINPAEIGKYINAKLVHGNIILRIEKKDLGNLFAYIKVLSGRYIRLNLIITDLEKFQEKDFNEYKKQLDLIENSIDVLFNTTEPIEVDFLTDRVFLTEMKNCNAGIDHITFAPNGQFYICPGFYYDDAENTIGTIETGINIANEELLYLDNAPICSSCDAFQCKRCIYLNRKLTLEINTPSKQQCVISHLSRNSSKFLLEKYGPLKNINGEFSEIPEISYLDPFELVEENQPKRFENYLNNLNQNEPTILEKENHTSENHGPVLKPRSLLKDNNLPPLQELSHERIRKMLNAPHNSLTNNNELLSMLNEILQTQKDILLELKKIKNG